MNNIKTKIYKNNDGFFRIKIFGYMDHSGQGRWLMDSDLMTLLISSHRSKEMTFGSISSANEAIARFHQIHSRTIVLGSSGESIKEPVYSETWTELSSDPEPKLTSKIEPDGSYSFGNIDTLFAWVKRTLGK